MVPAIFVIDDFLRNPHEVRAQALSMKYAVGGRYPGLNSVQKLRIEGLDQVISTLVGNRFEHLGRTIFRTAAAGSRWRPTIRRLESISTRATGPGSST